MSKKRNTKTNQIKCVWSQDSDGIYHAACGRLFETSTGDVKENGMKYCTFCGGIIEEKPFKEGGSR